MCRPLKLEMPRHQDRLALEHRGNEIIRQKKLLVGDKKPAAVGDKMITECQNYWVSAVPAGWLAGRRAIDQQRQLKIIVGSRNAARLGYNYYLQSLLVRKKEIAMQLLRRAMEKKRRREELGDQQYINVL